MILLKLDLKLLKMFLTLFAASLCVSAASFVFEEPLYKAVGDQIVLTPDFVPDVVSNITWKRGDEVVAEFNRGEVHVHPQFKGRVSLSNSTGNLTIARLTQEDGGSFTAEINERRVFRETQLLVIARVSKPSISVWCEPDNNFCFFTCEGNTPDAEPVTFRWRLIDAMITSSNMLRVTKDDEPWFSCYLENPVSYKSSEIVINPLRQAQTRKILALVITFFSEILIVIVLSCCLCCFCKCRKGEKVKESEQEKSQILPQSQEAVLSPDTKTVNWISEKSLDSKETSS